MKRGIDHFSWNNVKKPGTLARNSEIPGMSSAVPS
jgi:hypothetical protein